MNLTRANCVVLDLETERSADDCLHCGLPEGMHLTGFALCVRAPGDPETRFERIGWDSKAALGLSIGCYWDYQDMRLKWFDPHILEDTMRLFVERQCLLVSFNGIGFDFPLMRGLLRRAAEEYGSGPPEQTSGEDLTALCDAFKALARTSYDILAEIWKIDPERKFTRGVNSLDAISQANGLGAKEMDGAHAPRLWAAGRYAEVIAYCADDVLKTKSLFELICHHAPIVRGDGQALRLPMPNIPF